MNTWNTVADETSLKKTIIALGKNGIAAMVVDTGEAAKNKVLELLPLGAHVMTMTSVTMDMIGVTKEILESGKYEAVRNRLNAMDRQKDQLEMHRLGSAPEWVVGSVHAVTEDGKVVVASNTGSQLPAYAYGASHVIWVVGAQKIVKNLDDAFARVYEHVLPLESERAHKAYGVPGSFVSKLLVINKEVVPNRITMIIVKESLGF